ncbi:GNAT family N-acetyltransferase [Phytomonospora sp. NPDC050363]|uniref:GNAT family N-acetyltransferase n=1 Tax=Phytomonospora sp. NPDC050363 TaxID=3155642 RepID=UPI003404D02F
MPELQLLDAGHVSALLAFELDNRDFFAATIPDRGDAYFAEFDERLAALLAEQAEGVCFFHVLVDDDGSILGRFNLVDVADGQAELGFRLAEKATGRGLATAAVAELFGRAARDYGLTSLRAGTTLTNTASRAVLERNGFQRDGVTEFRGRPALTFVRDLREFTV